MQHSRIIVVEDDKIIARDIRYVLESNGYYLLGVVSSGEEAIEKVKEERPDLILMDVKLKGDKDGIETAQEINKLYDVPVVYLTSYVDEETFSRAKITGPFGYIIKPFEETALCSAIEIALYKSIMERKLKESERWFSTMLKSIGDAVIATGKEGMVRFMNPVAETLTGWTSADAFGRDLCELFILIDEDTGNPIEVTLDKIMDDNSSLWHTYHFILKSNNGVEIPIDFNSSPIRDENGNMLGVVLVFSDITTRRQADKKLRESEELYRTMAEAAQDMIYILNRDGCFVYVNSYLAELLGCDGRQLAGKQYQDFFPAEVASKNQEKMAQVLSTGKKALLEAHLKFGRHEFWVDESLFPINDGKGEVQAVLVIARDITHHKKGEEFLRLAKEHAESASKEKSRFIAHISHEIRTPLNAITGFAELLSKTSVDDTQIDYINTINESSNVLLALIEDILDISRIEAGRINLESEPLDMEYLIENVVKMLRPRLKGRQVVFNMEYDEEDPTTLLGDITRISQILLNLLNNALKFTPQGEVHAAIEIEQKESQRSDRKSRIMKIHVKDTGIGIPEDIKKHIFDAFTQADASSTRKYGGTGLGLTITKTLVEKMRGDIHFVSEVGKGTEFFVKLRLREGDLIPSHDRYGELIQSVKGNKVCLFDTNENSRRIMKKYAQKAGLDVLYETSRVESLMEWLPGVAVKPDVLVVDLESLDREALLQLNAQKARDDLKYIRIVGVVQWVDTANAAAYADPLCDGYLNRPVLWKEFIQLVSSPPIQPGRVIGTQKPPVSKDLSLKGIAVLLAEDDPISQRLGRIMLSELGCVVEIAGNGMEVIEKLKAGHFNVVIMDLSMPVLGGIEATMIIRKEIDRDIPIIALTAFVSDLDEKKCMEAGMNDFIAKPIRAKELKSTILKWVHRDSVTTA